MRIGEDPRKKIPLQFDNDILQHVRQISVTSASRECNLFATCQALVPFELRSGVFYKVNGSLKLLLCILQALHTQVNLLNCLLNAGWI
jgi:hypothetical protein